MELIKIKGITREVFLYEIVGNIWWWWDTLSPSVGPERATLKLDQEERT